MTPVELIESLASELEKATAHFKFIAEQQEPKRISIYRHSVPHEEFETDSFFPMIVVELLSIEDTAEGSIASILLTLGTYHGSRRADYWREHLNLAEEVRQFVLTNRILANKFILNLPVYFGLVEQQSESFMFSNMFVTYYVAQPISALNY